MRLSVVALALAVSTTIPTYANVFRTGDAQGLDAMRRPLLNAQQDNLSVVRSLTQTRSFDFADCINHITGELRDLYATVSSVSTLLHISAVMVLPVDENVVNDSIASDIKSALTGLPISRQYLNQISGTCGASAIVVARAQVALRFFEDAERILLWLRSRF
jgi:hypothetical protein